MARSNAPICVVRGSINCDEYFHVHHISRPGETISSTKHERRIGGKGANQAVAIARAGGQVEFVGAVGNDGLWIKEELKEWGVGIGQVEVVHDISTGRAIIQVDEHGENSIVLFPGANHSYRSASDHEIITPTSGGFLLLQNEINHLSTVHAMSSFHDRPPHSSSTARPVTFFNPSPLPSPPEIRAFPWTKVDWLIVNEGEARELLGSFAGEKVSEAVPLETPCDVVLALSKHNGFENLNVICTLGARGVVAFVPAICRPSIGKGAPTTLIQLPAARNIAVRDTTGAGDCFAGYLVAGVMRNADAFAALYAGLAADARSLEDMVVEVLNEAIWASGICVESSGTVDSIPFREEVLGRMLASAI